MAEITFETIESAPEAMRPSLKPSDDGKFVFRYEPTERLAEFRTNNITLAKERDELKAKLETFGDLDAEAARKALAVAKQKPGETDAAFEKREKELRQEFEVAQRQLADKLKAAEDRASTLESERRNRTVEDKLRAVADRVGLRDKAVREAARTALEVFAVEGDAVELVARDANGDRRMTKDGKAFLDVESWLSEQKEGERDYWFQPSTGGGAAGNATKISTATKQVSASDADALRRNFDAIAAGTVTVVQ